MVANGKSKSGKSRAREGGVVSDLRERAAEVSEVVRSGAKQLRAQAADKAGDAGQFVREEALRAVNDRKSQAVAQLKSVGANVRKAARLLEGADVAGVGQYVGLAAEGVDRAAQYLDERDLGEMVEDVGDLAREHPAAIVAGMLVLGLAASRIVQAGRAAIDEDERAGREEDDDAAHASRSRSQRSSRGKKRRVASH